MELSQQFLDDLYRSHEWSRRQAQPFEETRVALLRQLAAKHYSGATSDRVPFNLLKLTTLTYLRLCVSNTPKSLVTTRYQQLRSLADDAEQWLNFMLEEMDLGKHGRRVVLDALLGGFGVMKVGMCGGEPFEYEGQTHQSGQVYCERVGLGDWCHDMAAKSLEQCWFMGHRFQRLLADAKADESYDKAARAALQPCRYNPHHEGGNEKAETISRSQAGDSPYESSHPMVELWEVYLPRGAGDGVPLVVTCPCDETGAITGPPLSVREYVGPREGPYVFLVFFELPDNSVGLAPANDWLDNHLLFNELTLKIGRQASSQKNVGLARAGSTKDAQVIMGLKDGEVGPVDSTDNFVEVSMGGVKQENVGFLLQFRNLIDWISGNLSSLAGLQQQASTATQEKLLVEQSSGQVKDMQDLVVKFMRQVLRRLSWWFFEGDRFTTYEATKRVPGVSFTTYAQITPQKRQGNYGKLNFEVSAVSLRQKTHAEISGQIKALVAQLWLPALPAMMQQGAGINWQKLNQVIARYDDIPELDEILTFAEPAPEEEPRDEPPRMPSQTTRTYERVSRSDGPTMRGQMNAFAAGVPGQAEVAEMAGSAA